MSQKRTRRLTWRKRLMFNSLMLLVVYATVEVLSLVLLLLNCGSISQINTLRGAIASRNPMHPMHQFELPRVIHPYIGAVQQPKDDSKSNIERFRITEFGFVDDDLPIHKRTPERLIVAILGGSVAREFSLSATEILAEELSKSPEFAGRTIKFVRLASNGYKQPQQLMTINFLLTLGAEFDVVINMDGFNEAALPAIDNVPFGVFAAYPRDWGKMVAVNTNPEFVRMGGYIAYLREHQIYAARRADGRPWRHSPSVQLVWSIRNQRYERDILRQMKAMSSFTEKELSYCTSGPPEHFDSTEEMYQHCIGIWRRSSILLHQLCDANRIRYFHFLQPNQYLVGSKPIEMMEARMAVDEASPNGVGVKACYPLMKEEGSRFAASGVSFTDFTNVFAEHPEQIYIDTCCHVNLTGNVVMARAMGRRIRELVAQEKQGEANQ